MTTFKGTPGEWVIKNPNNSQSHIIAEHGQVCVLPSMLSSEEAEANAQLIASAPELLVALNKCLETLRGINFNISKSQSDKVFDAMIIAHNTIKKATSI